MSRLIFHKDYIIVIPTYGKVESHQHMMQHIFINPFQITFLDSGVTHAGDFQTENGLFLLIDTTCVMAEQLREKYLQGLSTASISFDTTGILQAVNQSDEELIGRIDDFLQKLGVCDSKGVNRDARIEEILTYISTNNIAKMNVSNLAERFAFSTSRLTHLFREQTGTNLKNHLLLCKLRQAYTLVLQNRNLTEAALESGFSDSAHLSATCKNLTGIPLSSVIKS